MNTQSPEPGALRRALFSRYTLIAFVAGAALATGAVTLASTEGMTGAHHGMMGCGHSAEDLSTHFEHVLKHLYVEIEATDAQKAQIDPLVKQAISDLQPLHSQLAATHTQVAQALAQTPVDRAALEAARTAHLEFADQASKRIVQLIEDVADVLTPTQRKAFAEHLAKMHGA